MSDGCTDPRGLTSIRHWTPEAAIIKHTRQRGGKLSAAQAMLISLVSLEIFIYETSEKRDRRREELHCPRDDAPQSRTVPRKPETLRQGQLAKKGGGGLQVRTPCRSPCQSI